MKKKLYDRHTRIPEFNVGGVVYLEEMIKSSVIAKELCMRWQGPPTIAESISPVNVRIANIQTGVHKVVHVNKVKRTGTRPTNNVKDCPSEEKSQKKSSPETTNLTTFPDSAVNMTHYPVDETLGQYLLVEIWGMQTLSFQNSNNSNAIPAVATTP